MIGPIQFPSAALVVRDEAIRFRALSPDLQRRTIDGMFRDYRRMLVDGDHPEFARRCADQEEVSGREAWQALIRNG